MKKFALIVAGGSGTRMGGAVPKQFLEIQGKPLIYYSAKAFTDAFPDIQIILVFPIEYLKAGETIFKDFPGGKNIRVTSGGATRFHSVQNGLQLVEPGSIVFVHDAVRCLVSASLIRRCYDQAVAKGSAVPAIAVKDSVRLMDKSGYTRPLDREMLRSVQTPQTFQSDFLLTAFKQGYKAAFTDEATVVENGGQKIELIDGEEANIKITYPIDMIIAEQILKSK
jgi:2-C-methyl-D-erythritol 4-phosphate cytidylyltransferase